MFKTFSKLVIASLVALSSLQISHAANKDKGYDPIPRLAYERLQTKSAQPSNDIYYWMDVDEIDGSFNASMETCVSKTIEGLENQYEICLRIERRYGNGHKPTKTLMWFIPKNVADKPLEFTDTTGWLPCAFGCKIRLNLNGDPKTARSWSANGLEGNTYLGIDEKNAVEQVLKPGVEFIKVEIEYNKKLPDSDKNIKKIYSIPVGSIDLRKLLSDEELIELDKKATKSKGKK